MTGSQPRPWLHSPDKELPLTVVRHRIPRPNTFLSKDTLKLIEFGDHIDVIYGCFWYKDFDRKEHEFHFILSVDQITTYPDIAEDVDPSYTKWT